MTENYNICGSREFKVIDGQYVIGGSECCNIVGDYAVCGGNELILPFDFQVATLPTGSGENLNFTSAGMRLTNGAKYENGQCYDSSNNPINCDDIGLEYKYTDGASFEYNLINNVRIKNDIYSSNNDYVLPYVKLANSKYIFFEYKPKLIENLIIDNVTAFGFGGIPGAKNALIKNMSGNIELGHSNFENLTLENVTADSISINNIGNIVVKNCNIGRILFRGTPTNILIVNSGNVKISGNDMRTCKQINIVADFDVSGWCYTRCEKDEYGNDIFGMKCRYKVADSQAILDYLNKNQGS